MLDLVIKYDKDWDELVHRNVCRGLLYLKKYLAAYLINKEVEFENGEHRWQKLWALDVSINMCGHWATFGTCSHTH